MLMYPEKMIWDVGGVTPILGERLIDQLKEQAQTFDPTIVLGQKVVDVTRDVFAHFLLTTADGTQHYSRTVILAVGYGALSLQKLEIEGADRYEINNLHYTVQEVDVFRDKNIVISGGGNSAVDWANTFIPIAKSVTVIHRRNEFGGHEMNVRKMKESSARICTPYEVVKLHGSNDVIEEITIRHLETEEEERFAVDEVIVNHGLKCDFGALKKWGIEMKDDLAVVDNRCATNIPGIYGIGDFVNYESKVRLIAGAFTDAALAVNNAKLFIEPDAPEAAYVSSHNICFKERNKQLGLDDDNYREVRG